MPPSHNHQTVSPHPPAPNTILTLTRTRTLTPAIPSAHPPTSRRRYLLEQLQKDHEIAIKAAEAAHAADTKAPLHHPAPIPAVAVIMVHPSARQAMRQHRDLLEKKVELLVQGPKLDLNPKPNPEPNPNNTLKGGRDKARY